MRCLRECGRPGCGIFPICVNTYMNNKHHQKPEGRADVCIGWFCDYRDKCARHIEANEVVVVRYFQPIKTGEHCEFYTEK